MAAPDVWVAKEDGSEIVRAGDIEVVSRDYNGTITARLSGGEGSAVVLVAVTPDEGKQTPDGFHRQLIGAVAQLSDAAGAALVRPEWDEPHGWRWVSEPL
jgi:hypothetical protein